MAPDLPGKDWNVYAGFHWKGLSKAMAHMLSILFLLAGEINRHPPSVKVKRGQYEQFHGRRKGGWRKRWGVTCAEGIEFLFLEYGIFRCQTLTLCLQRGSFSTSVQLLSAPSTLSNQTVLLTDSFETLFHLQLKEGVYASASGIINKAPLESQCKR